MRLRTRIVAVIAGLLAAALVGMAVLARGLLHQAAADAAAVSTDVVTMQRWLSAVGAASDVLWLGAATIGAVLFGAATLLARSYLTADLERLDRLVTRESAGDASGDEVSRLRVRFSQLATELDTLRGGSSAVLAAAADYRDELAQASDQLIGADRHALTGKLGLGVAHEIGGPLAVAQAALDTLPLLDGPDDDDERRQTLADLQDAILRIDTILRDFSDLGLGRTADESAAGGADIPSVIERVQRLGRLHTKVRGVSIEGAALVVGEAADLRGEVAMPAARLEQVLLNLVVNAADAMGGTGTVRVQWQRVADELVLDVEDSGPGIDPADRERVFEPFVTSKDASDGTGLGLAVSRRLVTEAGGTLVAQASEDLSGARLRITLPAKNPPPMTAV